MSSFEVRLYLAGETVVFYGDEIRRDTANGAGEPVLYAPCFREIDPKKHTFDRRGVINLNPDWTVKSLFWDD